MPLFPLRARPSGSLPGRGHHRDQATPRPTEALGPTAATLPAVTPPSRLNKPSRIGRVGAGGKRRELTDQSGFEGLAHGGERGWLAGHQGYLIGGLVQEQVEAAR